MNSSDRIKVIVTGSSGFVGKRYIEYNKDRYELIPVSLRTIDPATLDLKKADVIVHLAGKAHEMKAIDDKVYFDINFELTKKLANEAKRQGIPAFIYISSVKVYGDKENAWLDESSPCEPNDAYGKSKLEAEEYLRSIESPNFKVAVIRPPLVYGPGVKGNMIRLLQLAEKNLPLPLGGIENKRSMVFLDNLVELINRLIDKKTSGTFIAGDALPLSTGELMSLIRGYMNKKQGLITIPGIGRRILKVIRPGLFNRLFGSFVINNHKTNESLNFTPPYSTEYGVKMMVDWYLEQKKAGKLNTPAK